MEWLESLILGLVQGITEFLPVSSDGHLSVVQHLFVVFTGKRRSGEENVFFDVVLHLGTTLAILVHYRKTITAAIRGFFGRGEVAEGHHRDELITIGILAFVATLPLIPDKLFFMKYIKMTYEMPVATGIGFWITAAALALTARLKGGDVGPRETRWWQALLIGIAQAFAPLPGVSRSGLTIASALLLGFRKTWAVGFSLLIAVPAIMGATVFEIKDVDRSTLSADRVAQMVAGAVLAGLVGYLAIVWLARVVKSGQLWYFSVYLVILGAIVLSGLLNAGEPAHAQKTDAPGRAPRSDAAGPHDGQGSPRPRGIVDRGNGVRPRPPGSRSGLAGARWGSGPRLDLAGFMG